MTKTEVEAAICALPGVVSYRETQNDLMRSIKFVITFDDGATLADARELGGVESWPVLRAHALRSAQDRVGCVEAAKKPAWPPGATVGVDRGEYPNGYVGAEYVCHKRVRAAKIIRWEIHELARVDMTRAVPDDQLVLLHFGEGEPSLTVRWGEVRGLEVGGYLVQYVDGYRSYSPAKAFEEGYSRITESVPPSEGT